MRVLLDTNVVVWLAADPDTVRPETLDLLREDATTLVLSTVVPWEVAIKWRLGKLVIDDGNPADWMARVGREFGVQALPISYAHALRVADLPDHHNDPFDRLLIAQSLVEDMPVVTGDRSFARYDVEVIAAR
jgi:PIN domain nuclease of toxin-antitoxin system